MVIHCNNESQKEGKGVGMKNKYVFVLCNRFEVFVKEFEAYLEIGYIPDGDTIHFAYVEDEVAKGVYFQRFRKKRIWEIWR